MSDAIETPLSSGATDQPTTPQSGAAVASTPATALAPLENIMANQAGQKIGYDTKQNAWVDAETRKPYTTGTATAPAPSVTLSAQPATPSLPAQAVGKEDMVKNSQTGQTLVFDKSQNAYVDLVTRKPYVSKETNPPVQNIPEQQKSAWDTATDIASGFYHQTVGAGVNFASQLYDQTKAYYGAHPDKVFPAVTNPANYAVDAAKDLLFKHAEKDPEHPLAQIAKGIVQSHIDTGKKAHDTAVAASEALKNGDYKNAALLYAQANGYGTATIVPMVGPAAAKIGEDFSTNPEYAAGETGGIITSILAPSYIGSKIMPRDVPISGENIPVRASVAEPGFVNQTAEALANKRMLQNFDVSETQNAARDSIANAATSTVRNPELMAARDALKQGAIGDFNAAIDQAMDPAHPFTQSLKEHYAGKAATNVTVGPKTFPNIAQTDSAYDTAIAAANGDFGAVAKALNESISPLYEKASQQSIADGGSSWKDMSEARDAAFRRGDVTEMNAVKAKMKSAFEKSNSTGSFDVANRLYAKLDDINRINDVFKSNAVVKPTPVDFAAQNRTAAGVDAGIIDGKALRTAVRKLNEDGTFKNVGVSQDTVNDLQRLGELLERSKVKSGMASVGWFGTAGRILKGMTGADRGLAYLMTHPDELKTAIGMAQGGAGIVNNQATQPTHRFDESSGRVVPVTP